MMQLIRAFLGAGYRLTFASAAQKTAYSADLEAIGVSEKQIRMNHSSFDEFLVADRPDIVVFDRFMVEEQYGWRVASRLPEALRILDTEDLHSLRRSREEAVGKGVAFSVNSWKQSDLTKREMASIWRSDLSLIISEFEFRVLKSEFQIKDSLLHYLPFMEDPDPDLEKLADIPFDQRNNFIWIGNGKHSPNADALIWLKQAIWPEIRHRLPSAEIHIYGAYFSDTLKALHEPKVGFMIKGWAEDAAEVLSRARVSLIPLRFGAGLKGKLVEAIKTGTPFVTTTIGAEGLSTDQLPGNCITDHVADFAQNAVKLYNDQTAWKEAQRGGKLVMESLQEENHFEKLLQRIDTLGQQLQEERTYNFIGAMLWHHSMNSTRYFTKWIEAKNSKS
ncbi:glycosyltransferase [Poritiphilus flavus]|uniref:Glycosyltransferase n=1 Tax=Poritiphilus flavus TaxID=2697053 RepID=A0A6L9EEK9_9FLAO|nr:glycosyltransferase [Poritiphilus flavus]NAS13204.1 glycosyltransferase [Poritiphilus flavus]